MHLKDEYSKTLLRYVEEHANDKRILYKALLKLPNERLCTGEIGIELQLEDY